jgi:hypothetical protein
MSVQEFNRYKHILNMINDDRNFAMLIKKVITATAVSFATLLSVSVANADGHSFNQKETNGRSSYISAARIFDTSIANVTFTASNNPTEGARDSKDVNFKDADGFLFTQGNDYGYVRLESEYGYRETSIQSVTNTGNTVTDGSGNINIGTAMVNLAVEYTFDIGEATKALGGGDGAKGSGFSLTPYITAGAGAFGVIGDIQYKGSNADRNVNPQYYNGIDDGFFVAPAVQGGLGLTIGLPAGIELYGEYTEMLAFTYETRGSNDVHMKSATGGLRVNF